MADRKAEPPPMPDDIAKVQLAGYEPFYDEESGRWLVGDDIGDLDEEEGGDDE
jgi:hypothetical protein